MTSQQQEMIEYNIQDVLRLIIEDKKLHVEKAMDQFYMSKTFMKLIDIKTGLYLEGPLYIYDMLQKELANPPEICGDMTGRE